MAAQGKDISTAWRRPGLSLAEVLVSAVIMSVLVAGMVSATLIATRAVDVQGTTRDRFSTPPRVMQELADDLHLGLTFSERTSRAVTLTVPDRDGDGLPESVRYAWSGTAGDPLTRATNGNTAVAVVDDVRDFDLSYLLRTVFPPPQACCHGDGTCSDERPDDCLAAAGAPQGRNSVCASVECPADGVIEVLFVSGGLVVASETGGDPILVPTALEQPRIDLMESWGFGVTLIPDDAVQADFDAAIAQADVAYVGPSISGGALAHKLTGKAIGIVSEFPGKLDNFGLSSSTSATVLSDGFAQTDALHYITEPFSGNPVTVFHTYVYSMPVPGGTLAPDLLNVGEVLATPTLVALDTGAQRYDGGTAPARRVHLPYVNAEVSEWTADAETIMKRAIEWAAGADGGGGTPDVCGDATCGPTEDPCNCPDDCGAPTAWEDPATTCDDGKDNDCDGQTDCEDANCTTHPNCCEPRGSHCIMDSECCSGRCNNGKNECQ